jgi:menaquinone-specific isochorismate synthase
MALARSPKNTREHALVVEAIRENLGGLCRRLDHTVAPGILSLGNGHHLLTKFEGQLKDGVKDEDVLQCLHPTPALGGSPKEKAMAVIRALEPFDRGWYGGPLGYVGLDWAEFVVGIRSALVRGKQLSVYAGAGIVEGSKPKAEWQEIENKISNFIKIIA